MIFANWKADLEARCKAFLRSFEETTSESMVRFRQKENVAPIFTGGQHFKDCCYLRCPVCGNSGTHVRSAFARAGKDRYEGGGKGEGYAGVKTQGRTSSRRDALCIGVDCEYGHSFNIVFQQDTGTELIQAEVLEKDLESWETWKAEQSKKAAAVMQ